MFDDTSRRKTDYLGCLGYNDNPNELGEPTYSAVLLATDPDGYALFHLLVISVEPIYPREVALLERAKGWLGQA